MIDHEVARRYTYLKGHALQLAKAFDLSEASYQRLFDDGLIPLDQFLTGVHGRVVTHDFERAFAQAARATCFPRKRSLDRYPTIDSILDVATEQLKLRLQQGGQTLLEQLAAGGAAIQPVLGTLILPESGIRMPDGDGKMRTPRFAPKTAQLMRALVRMGIFADDLIVYVGRVLPTAMREVSYTILDIPRIGRQIAACDQIGEITLVAKTQLPINLWGGLTKTQLKARPDIVPVRYNRGWIEAIEVALLDNGALNPGAHPKLAVRRPGKAPLLTEPMIVQWLEWFHEKEGTWPFTADHRPVWEKAPDGVWIANAQENWHKLDFSLRYGRRGLEHRTIAVGRGRKRPLSILQLRYAYGLQVQLTNEQIRVWMLDFWKKEGRWPSEESKDVWETDSTGNWHSLQHESWSGIASALRFGTRGLPGGSSIADFKARHGFTDLLTEALIVKWIRLFHAKEGRWPTRDDDYVWDRAENGEWVQQAETWTALSLAMRRGQRGLTRKMSLHDLRHAYGLHNDFSEEKLRLWIAHFKEKEGRWPTYRDEAVWDRDAQDQWFRVSERWATIQEALVNGRRGLAGGTTLLRFRERHGLADRFSEDKIAHLITLFVEKEGVFPNARGAKPVWDRTEDGRWVILDVSWRILDSSLSEGLAKLPRGAHLLRLRATRADLQQFVDTPLERRPDQVRRTEQRRARRAIDPT